MEPYSILGLDEGLGDEVFKAVWRDIVERAAVEEPGGEPPESLTRAWRMLQTEDTRLRYWLIGGPRVSSFQALLPQAQGEIPPIPATLWLKLLSER